MNPVIRRASHADLDAVCEIERAGRARWTRRQFEDELSLAFSDFYVLEIDGAVAGFAVAWRVAGDIQINNIGVRPDLRGRGLGKILVEHVARTLGGGTGRVQLEVDESNVPAIRLYERCGFRIVGRRRRYYGDSDALLMERDAK